MNTEETGSERYEGPWGQVQRAVDEFVDGYELIGEDADGADAFYEPNEQERYMISDAISGLLADEDFIEAYAHEKMLHDYGGEVAFYVAGFMFTSDFSTVALIRKRKPKWQAGLLNGIGGKIEAGETAKAAMVREFREETSLVTTKGDWRHFCELSGQNDAGMGGFQVQFFATIGDVSALVSMEEEQIEIIECDAIHALRPDMVENLPWLIALAIDHLRDGRPFFVKASY